MPSGARTEYLSLRRLTQAAGLGGEPVETYPEFAVVWAQLLPYDARERQETGTVKDEARARFRFPNNAPANTITNDDRIIWGSQTLKVIGVNLVAGQALDMIVTAETIQPAEA